MKLKTREKLAFVFSFLLFNSIAICQIPEKGADLPVLSSLKWGMTINEAKDHLGQTIKTVSDTVLSVEDSLVGSKVTVLLTFSEKSNIRGLNFVEVQFADNSVTEKLLSYLKFRYGENYQKQHKEKTKLFFFKINADSAGWTLENEGVALMTFSRGDDVIAIRLIYAPKYKKTF